MQKALQALDDARGELVDTLSELVRIPSVGGTDAESDVVHRVADRLKAEGIEVDLWPLPLAELTAQPDFPGMEVTRTESWGVVGRLPGAGGRSLMLNGHLDVVPPGDLNTWSEDPYSGRIGATHVH